MKWIIAGEDGEDFPGVAAGVDRCFQFRETVSH